MAVTNAAPSKKAKKGIAAGRRDAGEDFPIYPDGFELSQNEGSQQRESRSKKITPEVYAKKAKKKFSRVRRDAGEDFPVYPDGSENEGSQQRESRSKKIVGEKGFGAGKKGTSSCGKKGNKSCGKRVDVQVPTEPY